MSEKKSAAKMQRSKSFSEEHTPLMREDRETHKSKSLPKEEHVIDITSVTVFRVPKALSETKPEAYAPRKVGLGPFHHFRRDLYFMQRKKFDDVVEFVDADEKDGFRNFCNVLGRLRELQNVIRGSYAESLNLNHSALERVIAIDSIYLLNRLRNREKDTDLTDAETEMILTGDILMLENQIPGDLVLEIWKILKPGEESVLSGNIRAFCQKESPLELTDKQEDVLPLMKNGHLLNVLYNLILERESNTCRSLTREITVGDYNRKEEIRKVMRIYGAAKFTEKFGGGSHSNKKSDVSAASEPAPQVDFAGIADAISGINIHGGAVIQKELAILQKMPLGQFMNKLKDIDPDREENAAPVEEIQIPSVSLLTQYAGVRFEVCNGIKNIKFNKKKRTLYLPRITLTSNSEVVLRNLLAYEAAKAKPRSRLEFAEYVDLMCGIVDTPKDVRILRDAGIIADDHLRSAEIAGIFNGIWRSTGDGDEEDSSNIGVAIKEVNEFYGSRFNVRMRRFIHKHIYESWKLLAVISSVVALMLLALQAFCEIYDCNKHWFGGSKYDLSGLFDRVGSFSSM